MYLLYIFISCQSTCYFSPSFYLTITLWGKLGWEWLAHRLPMDFIAKNSQRLCIQSGKMLFILHNAETGNNEQVEFHFLYGWIHQPPQWYLTVFEPFLIFNESILIVQNPWMVYTNGPDKLRSTKYQPSCFHI